MCGVVVIRVRGPLCVFSFTLVCKGHVPQCVGVPIVCVFVPVIFASVFMKISGLISKSDSRFNHHVCIFSSPISQTMFVIGCFPY